MKKYEIVQKKILDWIAAGDYSQGDRLPPILKIAEKLNISDQPVRKAIRELSKRGVIEAHKGRGLFITGVREYSRKILILSSINPDMNDNFFTNWYFRELYQGILDTAREMEVELRLHLLDRFEDANLILKAFHEENYVGIILIGNVPPDIVNVLMKHIDLFRFVAVSNEGAGLPVNSIGIDYEPGIMAVLDRIYELGHRNIGFLYGRNVSSMWSHLERFRIFVKFCQKKNIPLSSTVMLETGGDQLDGFRAANQILDMHPEVTVIFCGTDERAKGVLQALIDRKLTPGADISVAGFDNIPDSEKLNLASVQIPYRQLGEKTVKVLFSGIRSKAVQQSEKIVTELVFRSSLTSPRANH